MWPSDNAYWKWHVRVIHTHSTLATSAGPPFFLLFRPNLTSPSRLLILESCAFPLDVDVFVKGKHTEMPWERVDAGNLVKRKLGRTDGALFESVDLVQEQP